MTDDELDRICAEVLGWKPETPCEGEFGEDHSGWFCQSCGTRGSWGESMKHFVAIPSPTRNPADFVALLGWCAEKGHDPEVGYSEQDAQWDASMWTPSGSKQFFGYHPSPMVALALAVRAWRAP